MNGKLVNAFNTQRKSRHIYIKSYLMYMTNIAATEFDI